MTEPKMRQQEIRRVKVADLVEAPWNPRTHSAKQKAAFDGIVDEIGFYGYPEIYVAADGRLVLIDGHLRKDRLISRHGPEFELEVNVVDFTEAEAKKATATKDALAGMAGFDPQQLDLLLPQATFDNTAVNQMLIGLAQAHKATFGQTAVIEDEVPLPPDVPITQAGDLWVLGEHRLLCGDSSLPADVDRLLDGAVIHLVNTDPPYNVKVEPRSNNAIAAGLSSFPAAVRTGAGMHHQGADLARHPEKSRPTGQMRAKDRPLANDFVSDEEFDRLLDAWFGNIARVLLPGRGFYVWGGYANLGNYPPFLKKHGLYFSQGFVWDKQHPVLTRKDFMGAFEIAFYGWREGAAHVYLGPNNATDLWHVKKVNPQSMVHLTEKPVELAVRAMEYSSQTLEHVLDLFGGSGSTLIGAEQSGRRAFLMELDEAYCDVIVTRWERLTGNQAVRTPAPPDPA